MFRSFNEDRKFIERKYHDPEKPFNPYNRLAYHGWEADETTGLSVEEIKERLIKISEKYSGLSHEIRKARAVEYVLDNTRIDISDKDYFPLIYTWGREIDSMTINKWKTDVFNNVVPEIKPVFDLFNESGASAMWPDFDHVVPDWDSVLNLGFVGLKKRAEDYRIKLIEKQKKLTESQIAFFDGIDIEYAAIIRLICRFYELSVKRKGIKSQIVSKSFKTLSEGAPKNFFDALMTIYLYFMISESIDHYQVRSLGNGLDNTLFRFYKKDLENKTFTKDEIKEFLAYFLMQWSAIGNYWGQPFYLGGTDKDGNTKINDLSHDIIDVYSELGIYNPKIQIKYSDKLPVDFLNKILTGIRQNVGSYVFCCEKGMIKAIMNYGATYDEAREYDIRGCYETGVKANEVSTCGAYINALKAIEYVFSNGYDKRIEKQVSIKTGDVSEFKTFDDFYSAFFKQLSYIIETSLSIVNEFEKYLGYMNPSSMYSATIVGSLQKGTDAYQSGVKFNNSAELCCGFASAVDSVHAVKELVFDKKIATMSELKNALDNNWKGYEKLQLKAKNLTHKYGNGDKVADDVSEAIAKYFALKVDNRPNARGGVHKATIHTAMQFLWQGQKTMATPDGRNDGEEMSKNASPSIGMDRNGATALISSALRLEPSLFMESFCVDVMLHPSAVQGDDGLVAMKGLLDVYYENDGQSMQFNVFNADMLRDAQVHPEKYQNLQVRVCGWNVLWNNLSRTEQDAYILRAENL